MKMTIAATKAPISGRPSGQVVQLTWTRLRSLSRRRRCGLDRVYSWCSSDDFEFAVVGRTLSPDLPCEASNYYQVLFLTNRQDRGDVAAVDEGRAGQDRLATTEDIAVLLKEIELCDGHVALQIGLLVDVKLDLAVRLACASVRVGVEGAGAWPCCRNPRGLLMVSSACGAPRVITQSIDLSSVSLAWIAEVTAESSWPLTCRFSVFGKLSFTPLQRGPRAPPSRLLDGAKDLGGAAACILLPACCPAQNSSEESG